MSIPGNPDCKACPFAVGGKPATYVGPDWPAATTPVEGVLVGEAPGPDEVKAGQVFVGRTGAELRADVANVGLDWARLGVVNAIACQVPPEKADREKDMAAARKACEGHLSYWLKKAGDRPVLAMGAEASKAVGYPKKWGRGFVAGRLHCTVHPTFAHFYFPQELGNFLVDLARFARHVKGVPLNNPIRAAKYTVMKDHHDLVGWLRDKWWVAVDLETRPADGRPDWTGKSPSEAQLRSLALGTPTEALGIPWPRLPKECQDIVMLVLSSERILKVFQNGYHFDIPILERYGARVDVSSTEDIRDMRRALVSTARVSLEAQASTYLDIHNWKQEEGGGSHGMGRTDEENLVYNMQDAVITAAIYKAMLAEDDWRDE